MEQYAKLPRNSVDGHRQAEVALQSVCSDQHLRGRQQQHWVSVRIQSVECRSTASWCGMRFGERSKEKGGCRLADASLVLLNYHS
jgi:hypothetical protein